jgi:D-alanyl-D-alanine carboxypeptidase
VGELQGLLDRFLQQTHAPGGVIGVARGGEKPIFVSSGVADPGTDVAISPDDLFFVASNTKVFTGVLVLRLAEQGLVDIDAPVDTYLPGWPYADRVTARQLLNHTSGYPSWCDDSSPECGDAITANIDRTLTLDEVLAFTKGRPLVELYRSYLLDPLALRRTFYMPGENLPGRPDGGLFELAGQKVDFRDIPFEGQVSMLGPAGAMVSTVPDLLRWGRALWRNGDVLKPATLADATRFTVHGTGLGMLGYSDDTLDFCLFSTCPADTHFAGPGGSGDLPGTVSTLVYEEMLDTVVSVDITSNINVPVERFTADVLGVVQRA